MEKEEDALNTLIEQLRLYDEINGKTMMLLQKIVMKNAILKETVGD
jgi:hypothetical protein